jgi:myo-inositol-1(or 4)-monophosphatase
MSDILDFTLHVARAGGAVLRERYLQPRTVHEKGWRDFYTDADVAAQTAIVELLRAHDPSAAILSEEGIHPPPNAATLWVIDPLDGTTNYAQHLPAFAVSIALVEHDQPIAGVVYDPLHDEAFTAERGRGAFLHADRLAAAPLAAAPTVSIASAAIGLDWGRQEQARAVALEWIGRAGQECRTIRAIGSAALGLCYLAAGRLDVYFHTALFPWDGAAAQLIAEEAGARLFDFSGASWHYTQPACLGCAPALIEWALDHLPAR